MEKSQKLITFVIPAFNSAPFLHYAVDSLTSFGNQIEVLIIDDGSKDDTGIIADDYARTYPFIRAIHQPNGGHGEGINHGLQEAKGLYFKVLDSDDWVEENALEKLLSAIERDQGSVDLYLTNYVYWQGRDHRGQVIDYRYLFKRHRTSGSWKDIHAFRYRSNITLHSAMYKTEILRKSGVVCQNTSPMKTIISSTLRCRLFVNLPTLMPIFTSILSAAKASRWRTRPASGNIKTSSPTEKKSSMPLI